LHVSCSRNDIARGKNKEENSNSLQVTDVLKIKRILLNFLASLIRIVLQQRGKCDFPFAVATTAPE